jgi:hypothetical protein
MRFDDRQNDPKTVSYNPPEGSGFIVFVGLKPTVGNLPTFSGAKLKLHREGNLPVFTTQLGK